MGELCREPPQVCEPFESAQNFTQLVRKDRCGKDDEARARPEEEVHPAARWNVEDVVPNDDPMMLEMAKKAVRQEYEDGKREPPPLRKECARAGNQQQVFNGPDHRVEPAKVVECDGNGDHVDPKTHGIVMEDPFRSSGPEEEIRRPDEQLDDEREDDGSSLDKKYDAQTSSSMMSVKMMGRASTPKNRK
jgi:hypothetical protein